MRIPIVAALSTIAALVTASPARGSEGLLRIAVAGSPPFVVETQAGRHEGVAVDVFRLVAAEAQLAYDLTGSGSVDAALAAVSEGRADVAVGPISITAARTASVAFTQPYYRAQMGIAAHAVGQSFWSRIRPFVSAAFAVGVGFLLLVLFGVGALVWALERRVNPDQFDASPLRGIGAGIWLALVTMTTVGYGDKAPVTIGGRIVVGIWMVIAMLTASSLTASIATALTLSQLDRADIEGLESLPRRPVAYVRGTTGAEVARRADARPIPVDGITAAIQKVVDGDADAALGDLPVLQYNLRNRPELPITLIAVDERVENYGFAVAHGSPLAKTLDVALLRLLETGRVEAVEKRWLAN